MNVQLEKLAFSSSVPTHAHVLSVIIKYMAVTSTKNVRKAMFKRDA